MTSKTFIPFLNRGDIELRFYFAQDCHLDSVTHSHDEARTQSSEIAERFAVPHAASANLPQLLSNRHGLYWRVIIVEGCTSHEDRREFRAEILPLLEKLGFTPGKRS